ncbi:MAG: nicotinamide-nucleotide adenylyltransferase [Thermoplasmata archaeon]
MRGLLVGRFQPFHHGHLAVVREVRAKRPDEELILGIGSAQESFTWKNPFTSGERMEMVSRALHEAGVDGVLSVPLPDIHQHALWVRYVESLVPPFGRVYTNNPLTRQLFEKAEYPVESPPLVDRGRLEGAAIRTLLASGGDWASHVPDAVARYLVELDAPARLAMLRASEGRSSGGTSA